MENVRCSESDQTFVDLDPNSVALGWCLHFAPKIYAAATPNSGVMAFSFRRKKSLFCDKLSSIGGVM